MIIIMVFPVIASAATYNLGYGTHDIDITIQINQDFGYVIPIKVGDKLMVNLTVASGGPADFFLTNKTAYDVYHASIAGQVNFDSLFVVEDYSRKEAGGISYTYDSLVDNELVVLIDNTAYTVGGAEPAGPITIHGQITVQRNVWTLQNIIMTIIIVVIIAAVMVGIRYPGKKKS